MKKDNNSPVRFLVGDFLQPFCKPEQPFSDAINRFLADLSKTLLHSNIAKQYPDVIRFAFYCRQVNIEKLKRNYLAEEKQLRRGLGTVFHITPSNMPTNFAYSLTAALLAGNASIVRVSQKDFPQTKIISEAIRQTLNLVEHKTLRDMITIISYDRNDTVTAQISSFANGRIIWGGDDTIEAIRQIPLTPRGVEVTFADRYSFSVIDSVALLANRDRVDQLATDFYNDTYFMGQAACSSPHLLLWIGKESQAAGDVFWPKLADAAQRKFAMAPVDVVDKYTAFLEDIIKKKSLDSYRTFGNYLYVLRLRELPEKIHELKGQSGYFYEADISSLDVIARLANEKVQTLTYYGFKQKLFQQLVHDNRFVGIDRIVPIGQALEFALTWDGYDLIRTLSRAISIQ